jgi:hypothetical protein
VTAGPSEKLGDVGQDADHAALRVEDLVVDAGDERASSRPA